MSIFIPTPEQIIEAHRRVVVRTGGSIELRSRALLESAIARSEAGYGEHDLYPTIEEKAAAIGCGLIQNHAFVDGNKRIGVLAMLLILRKNNVIIHYAQDELIAVGLAIASGEIDVPQVVGWIRSHK